MTQNKLVIRPALPEDAAGIAALEKLITTFQQLGHTSSQIILSTPVDRHTPLEYEEELP